jgi:hypothetical protein
MFESLSKWWILKKDATNQFSSPKYKFRPGSCHLSQFICWHNHMPVYVLFNWNVVKNRASEPMGCNDECVLFTIDGCVLCRCRPLCSTLLVEMIAKLDGTMPVTVAARSKAWTVFARSDYEIVGSSPTQGMDVWCVYAFILFVLSCDQRRWGLDDGEYLMCINSIVEFKKSMVSLQILYIYYGDLQIFSRPGSFLWMSS